MDAVLEARIAVLRSLGASDSVQEELLAYNENRFRPAAPHELPLADERFATVWQEYAREAKEKAELPFEALRRKLVQLRFPIGPGMSKSDEYRAATLQGTEAQEGDGIRLLSPELLNIEFARGPAGTVPVLAVRERSDFIVLVQALTARNEPIEVPESMGAAMVVGYNNWDRIRQYQQAWREQLGALATEATWKDEFRMLIPRKELYQDRFMLLSDGPYSGVAAAELGLDDEEWRELSLIIRREHEYTHYFTQRVCGSMQNKMLDELIADYFGIVAAAGTYRADWFLRFVGLEAYPCYRKGGRLEHYIGSPPLSPEAFDCLTHMLKRAAEGLEAFDRKYGEKLRTDSGRIAMMLALTRMTLEQLASDQSEAWLNLAMELSGHNEKK